MSNYWNHGNPSVNSNGQVKEPCKADGRQKLSLGYDCENTLFSVGYNEEEKKKNEEAARTWGSQHYYSNWVGGGSICNGNFTRPKCDHTDPNYCYRKNIPMKFGIQAGTECAT